MGSRLAVGFAVPQTLPPADLVETLREAEAAGLDSLWVQEQLLGDDPSLEPLTTLAFAAAATMRLRLGSAAFVLPLRNPVIFAKQLATLDVLSSGRAIAGVALGDVSAIYEAVGVPMAGRAARLEEAVHVMRELWTRPRATVNGIHTTLRNAAMAPKPAQSGGPPIWFGGHHPTALARAVRMGEGWIGAGGSSLADFEAQSNVVRRLLYEAARDRNEFTIAKKVYLSADHDAGRARDELDRWFEVHWAGITNGRELSRRVGVAGTPRDCVNALRSLRSAGADLVILNPVGRERDQLAMLVDSVLPAIS